MGEEVAFGQIMAEGFADETARINKWRIYRDANRSRYENLPEVDVQERLWEDYKRDYPEDLPLLGKPAI